MVETKEREVQTGGRITLPKVWREKYGLKPGTKLRLVSTDNKIEIEVPTKLSSLYGLVKTEKPCEKPKKKAREYMKERLKKELKG